jgi:hypothetical protein
MVPYRYSINLQNAQGAPVDYVKAVEMAEYEVFQKELNRHIALIPQLVVQFPALAFVMPFVKTLVNLISTAIDYTPVVGQAKNIDDLLGHHGNDARRYALAQAVVGAGIAAAAGGIGLIPVWPAQVASGGLELVNMTRDEANALGGYDKLAKEISKNFTPATDPSYLPENPAQSEGVGTLINRGKDFVKYLRRDSGITSQDIATQRNVGGNAIPSLGQPGKVVTSPTADKALTKLGGKNVDTTPGPTVSVQKRGSEYEPLASDVPAYVRRGLPDPVTTPVGKPKITVRPGETQSQAMQRTKAEQEFSRFLKGQGGQSFGTPGAGRGGQGGPTAAQTSGSGQVPTIKLPSGQTIPDPARLSPSGQYNTQSGSSTRRDSIDKIERDDKTAVDAMVNRAKQSVADRDAKIKMQPKWKNRDTDIELEEASRKKREQPEVDYDDDYDAMVARVKKLAGLGPMRTVWDPAKRQYRNMPTAQQPKK